MVNGSLFLPPVMLHSINQVSCANCTVDSECPGKMHCATVTIKSAGSENIHTPLQKELKFLRVGCIGISSRVGVGF